MNITKMPQLIVYVRYIFQANIIDFLCSTKLEGKTAGGKIFEVIIKYFQTNNLTWT